MLNPDCFHKDALSYFILFDKGKLGSGYALGMFLLLVCNSYMCTKYNIHNFSHQTAEQYTGMYQPSGWWCTCMLVLIQFVILKNVSIILFKHNLLTIPTAFISPMNHQRKHVDILNKNHKENIQPIKKNAMHK